MERTSDDRKKLAKKLIRLPESKRPSNVVYKPATRFCAKYEVELDNLIIHFQDDGNRVYYLGEYPKLEGSN